MHTEGELAPDDIAAARERFEAVGPTAQVVVREVARAMKFDREEYRERVDEDVVATVRDALFAHELAVHVGTREEFNDWRADHDGYEVTTVGSEGVDNVAWHAAPFAREAVAATFQNEPEAAVSTLRRQAFGRIYRERLYETDADANHDVNGDAGDEAGQGTSREDGGEP